MGDREEFSSEERAALDAWTADAPPSDFAERVIARDVEARAFQRRRTIAIAALGGVAAAGVVAAVLVHGLASRSAFERSVGDHLSSVRASVRMGGRAIAVSEPGTSLRWSIERDGTGEVEQSSGSAFYRVEPGGAFIVKTPVGHVRVVGTCFRVEVEDMGSAKIGIAAAAGAAIASAVIVTVYEGKVVTASPEGEVALAAGEAARMKAGGAPVRIGEGTAAAALRGAGGGKDRAAGAASIGASDSALSPAECIPRTSQRGRKWIGFARRTMRSGRISKRRRAIRARSPTGRRTTSTKKSSRKWRTSVSSAGTCNRSAANKRR
jgi:hypothetical protein